MGEMFSCAGLKRACAQFKYQDENSVQHMVSLTIETIRKERIYLTENQPFNHPLERARKCDRVNWLGPYWFC